MVKREKVVGNRKNIEEKEEIWRENRTFMGARLKNRSYSVKNLINSFKCLSDVK